MTVVNPPPPEEEPPAPVEPEKPKSSLIPSMTVNEYNTSLNELRERAKAAGLRPMQIMLASYLSQGLSVVDGLLEALEGKKNEK